MTINLSSLASAALAGPTGQAGVGINSTVVLANGNLYITYSNNVTANAGYVTGAQGIQGVQGNPGTVLNSSGLLPNAVIIANTIGYSSNSSNLLFYDANSTLRVANTISVNNFVYAANGLPWSFGGGGGSISITNDTVTNSNNYFLLLSLANTGTLATANTSNTKLYFNPSTGTLNSTVFNSLSDENQKTNIQIIQQALSITEGLKGVTFEFKDSGKSSAGLVAQDVERWLPQLVDTQENGTKSLNYNGIIGVLVEAVKDLSERVKELESK